MQPFPKEEAMKYALLIYDKPGTYDDLEAGAYESIFGEYAAISSEPATYGGAQLQPVETATTVRVQDGQALTTDGPFADTKEVFGGFFLVDADNLDDALALAARVPAARLGGCVEVRPVVERAR
jgi:hypothetical protein